jgi:hypothetical protein
MTAKKRLEQKRMRLRVFERMADSDIDPHVLISNMALVCKWLESGIVPRKDGKPDLKIAVQ